MSLSISNITPVAPLGANDPLSSIGERGKPGEFQKVLDGAINGVESLNSDASDSVQRFLTGETEELHSVALAAERAEVAFQLGLQVRNKVISAYQEIMRMQL